MNDIENVYDVLMKNTGAEYPHHDNWLNSLESQEVDIDNQMIVLHFVDGSMLKLVAVTE